MGHWDDIFGTKPEAVAPISALIDLSAEHAEEVEHSQHCHTNLASCSAQPLPSGLGLLITSDTSLRPPPLRYAGRVADTINRFTDHTIAPQVPPPRFA